jgi:hypothetical protein
MDLHSGSEPLYLLSVWCSESIELTSYAVFFDQTDSQETPTLA